MAEDGVFTLRATLSGSWRDMEGRFARLRPQDDMEHFLLEAAPRILTGARAATPRRTGDAAGGWEAHLVRASGSHSYLDITNRMSYGMVLVYGSRGPFDVPNAFGRGPSFGVGGRFSGKFHPRSEPIPALQDWLHTLPDEAHGIALHTGHEILTQMAGH